MKQINQLTLSAIVAMADNRVIGNHNQLPWRLPADLKRFKTITMGHPILMGRKTYESIGKPLPNRLNIILTRNLSFKAVGCFVTHTVADAIDYATFHGRELFVIGGADIYQQFLPYINRLFLTVVAHVFEGDAYFPLLNPKEWREISCETHGMDDHHAYSYRFLVLERISR